MYKLRVIFIGILFLIILFHYLVTEWQRLSVSLVQEFPV